MKTSEMKQMIYDHCTAPNCEPCALNNTYLCGGIRRGTKWVTGTSKDTRKAFHTVFPDYFKQKNMSKKNESIVIWVEDNEVYAKRLSTGESGVAKCSPKDEFNLLTGINLAVLRMLGEETSWLCAKCKYLYVPVSEHPCLTCCRSCWEDNFKEEK